MNQTELDDCIELIRGALAHCEIDDASEFEKLLAHFGLPNEADLMLAKAS